MLRGYLSVESKMVDISARKVVLRRLAGFLAPLVQARSTLFDYPSSSQHFVSVNLVNSAHLYTTFNFT